MARRHGRRIGYACGNPVAVTVARVAEVRASLEEAILPAPLRRPLPHVSAHVVKAEAVGGKRAGGGETGMSVPREVPVGEPPLPDVARLEILVIRRAVAPGLGRIEQPAPCGMLPFDFGR